MRALALAAALMALMLAGTPWRAAAQVSTTRLPPQCGAGTRPAVPPEAQRRAAREMAARAQEAAITDDAARARDLYQRAAQLDPSDPAIAYALGRAYETAHDARASAEYCRFLALSPNAPNAQDVRERLAAFAASALAAAPPSSPPIVVAPRTTANPGGAFATGLILPGGGQYVTHRPMAGLLVTAAVGGALYYALQSQTVHDSILRTATDPNGQPYQFYAPTVRTDRSHLAPGIAAAAGISLIAAIEAYSHARGERTAARTNTVHGVAWRVSPTVTDFGRRVGVGASVALGGS